MVAESVNAEHDQAEGGDEEQILPEGLFSDGRRPERIEHTVFEMLSQRIDGLALGYEDLNDHEQLRKDVVFGLLSGKRALEAPLAGKSTLNRLELSGRSKRYHKISPSVEAIDRPPADLFIESHTAMPKQIVLDLDATDIPLYGHQPERFFTATTTATAILPLYIFAGDQLLARAAQSCQPGRSRRLDRGTETYRWPTATLAASQHRAAR